MAIVTSIYCILAMIKTTKAIAFRMLQTTLLWKAFGEGQGYAAKTFPLLECDDLRAIIEQALHYFNYERPVRKLKEKPPVLYKTELVE